MGFRSTFITEDQDAWEWPDWFVMKYRSSTNFSLDPFSSRYTGPLSSMFQGKCGVCGGWAELPEDIQKAIPWEKFNWDMNYILVYLHECGGITRVQIEKNRIIYTEPESWNITTEVTHSYCHGCSDVD
jgi:hypothetical protein